MRLIYLLLLVSLGSFVYAKKVQKTAKAKVAEKTKKKVRFFRGQRVIIGKTVKRRNISMYRYGYQNKPIIFFIGGIHGNEPQAVRIMRKMKRDLDRNRRLIPRHVQLWLVPLLNVDGHLKNDRLNHRKVDINRNFGTKNWQRRTVMNETKFKSGGGPKPFSEPETRALRWVFKKYQKQIKLVINFHCCGRVIDGKKESKWAMGLQRVFLKHVKFRTIKKSWSVVAYPVTGSFAQWHWEKFRIPDLFIELDKKVKRPYRELKKPLFAVINHRSVKRLK